MRVGRPEGRGSQLGDTQATLQVLGADPAFTHRVGGGESSVGHVHPAWSLCTPPLTLPAQGTGFSSHAAQEGAEDLPDAPGSGHSGLQLSLIRDPTLLPYIPRCPFPQSSTRGLGQRQGHNCCSSRSRDPETRVVRVATEEIPRCLSLLSGRAVVSFPSTV